MIDIHFNYKEKKTQFNCSIAEPIIEVFKRFASENNVDFNDLLFIYEGQKINIELDLIIEDQFELKDKSKIKNEITILVFDNVSQDQYYVKFKYNAKDELIKCTKKEKINVICQKFTSKINVDISHLLLLYNGETIVKDDLDNKTFDDLANKIDKEAKIMNIVVYDIENRDSVRSVSSNQERPFGNEQNPELVNNLIEIRDNENNENNENYENNQNNQNNENYENNQNENQVAQIVPNILEEKNYYLKFLLILFIQYGLISFLFWLGSYLKINEKFTTNKAIMLLTLISTILVMIASSIIYFTLLEKYKKEKFLYSYHILYGLFIIFNCFLLSKYTDTNNILCTLFLIVLEILAMGIYVFIFKFLKIYLFGLSSFILGLLSTIGFYFWIEDIITIIIIYSIGFSIILYLVGIIYYSLKVCKRDEFIYASMIYDYSIFFALAIGLKTIFTYIYKYLIRLKDLLDDIIYFLFRIYLLLIIQLIFIIGFVWIGFELNLNLYLISESKVMFWIFIPSLLILAGMCAILYRFREESREKPIWYIYHFLYVPFIIIYSFLLSSFINEKIILCLLFIYALDLITLIIYILLIKSYNIYGLIFAPFFMSIISVILFHFLWIKDDSAVLYISIIALVNVIYLTGIQYYTLKNCYHYEYTFAVTFFNYAIFGLIFAATIGLIVLVFYLIIICIMSCCCSGS